jgi:hypothetical protein
VNGKGSKARPMDVSKDTYDSNWERTFGGAQSDESQKPLPTWLRDYPAPTPATDKLVNELFTAPNATVAQSVERPVSPNGGEGGGSSPLGRSLYAVVYGPGTSGVATNDWPGLVATLAPIQGESFVIERPSFSTQYVRATLTR